MDNFLARNKVWEFPDPLNPSNSLSLRHRRDMTLNSRQLCLSLGMVRNRVTELVRDKRLEVGSSGLGRSVYILRGPHGPVQVAAVTVDSQGAIDCCLDRDSLLEFCLSQHAASIEAAAQVQLQRPFRR
eukprot:4531127-Pyramimonas_sp.AAC.1